jgi:hypothetical protein
MLIRVGGGLAGCRNDDKQKRADRSTHPREAYLRFFLFAALEPSLPSARRVFFGRWAMVRFLRAALAALRMFVRLAAMVSLFA